MKGIYIYPDGRISRKDAAKYIGVKPSTLRTWNCKGVHDEFFSKIVIASKVYYRFTDVKSFCECT